MPNPHTKHRLDGDVLSAGCHNCGLLEQCGGYYREVGGWDCMDGCQGCDRAKCQRVCLNNANFERDVQEVGGFSVLGFRPFESSPAAGFFPKYIPTIAHGSSRTDRLYAPWVALPVRRVFSQSNGGYQCVASSPSELRARFRIGEDTRVLLLGTGDDPEIEPFWRYRASRDAPGQIARLGLCAMVAPNFSMEWSDPRPHHLHARKRTVICASEIDAAGVPVIIPLQAVTEADWTVWERFLEEHPEISVVAKEFQTGARLRSVGEPTIDRLARLQDSLGRPLHLLAIGAHQYWSKLEGAFDRWTVTDATPFQRAVHRAVAVPCGGVIRWEKARDEAVDRLLDHNVIARERIALGEARQLG